MLEIDILAGSVINRDTSIDAAGQRVEDRDMSGVGFNHDWQ